MDCTYQGLVNGVRKGGWNLFSNKFKWIQIFRKWITIVKLHSGFLLELQIIMYIIYIQVMTSKQFLRFWRGEAIFSVYSPPTTLWSDLPRDIILGNSIPNRFLKFANRYTDNCEFCVDFCEPNFRPFSVLFEGQPHIRLVFGGYVFVVVAPPNIATAAAAVYRYDLGVPLSLSHRSTDIVSIIPL